MVTIIQVIFSVVASMMHCKVLDHLLGIRKKWWAWLLAFGASAMVAGMVIYIGDWDNILPTEAVFLGIVWLACQGSFLKKLTIGMMLSHTVFAINALIDNFFVRWETSLYMDMFLGMRVFAAIILYLGTKKFAPEKGYELPAAMWRLLILLTLMPMGIVLSTVLLSSEMYVDLPNENMYFMLLTLAVVSFIGLLWAVRVLVKQKQLEQQVMTEEIRQNYYDALERQHFEIRRMKHDLANHLQILQALPEEQRMTYIQELIHNPALAGTLDYCGDPTVNAVLSVKDAQMNQREIAWERTLEIPSELPFEKADICALFANALDNAMEACMELDVSQRSVILEGRVRKGLLAVSVKNACVGQGDGVLEQFPQTTKKDARNHGYGLRSIKEIVERYHGEMEVKKEDGAFELFFYLPIK